MSTIRCIYTEEPKFPATDQHPLAVRYQVAALFVDALGGAPTQAEVNAVLGTDAASVADAQRKSDIDVAIAGDATVQSLKTMTVAEFDAWWTANVTNLAQASAVLKRIARVVIRKLL